MHTEVVTDRNAYDFSGVSYNAGTTQSVVGWANGPKGSEDISKQISVPEGETSTNVYAIVASGNWVTFDSDGGSAVNPVFVQANGTLTLDGSTTPSRPGYTFEGWYDGENLIESGTLVTEPLALNARWEAKQVNYTINYWQQKTSDNRYDSDGNFVELPDSQKTYDFVSADEGRALAGSMVSASDIDNLRTFSGFELNMVNSSASIEIAGDESTIINVYYDRMVVTVNFLGDEQERELICGMKEHSHSRSGCYELDCPYGGLGITHWWHDDNCYDSSHTICGMQEHQHTDACYAGGGREVIRSVQGLYGADLPEGA